jgi:hypothetical protein
MKPLRLPSAPAVIARNEAIQYTGRWIASFLAMTADSPLLANHLRVFVIIRKSLNKFSKKKK